MDTLRTLRLQSGKSVKEVAAALNVTQRAVFNYEYGLRRISLEQIQEFAKLYGCSESEIISAALNSLKSPKDN